MIERRQIKIECGSFWFPTVVFFPQFVDLLASHITTMRCFHSVLPWCSQWCCESTWHHCFLAANIPSFHLLLHLTAAVLLLCQCNVMLSSSGNTAWTVNLRGCPLSRRHIVVGWIVSDLRWSAVTQPMRDPALSTSCPMKCHPVFQRDEKRLQSFFPSNFLCSQPKVLWQSGINCAVFILLVECIAWKWCWPQHFLCRRLFIATGCTVERMHRCVSASSPHGDMMPCLKSPLCFCVATCITCQWKGHVFSSWLLPLLIILVFATRAGPLLQGIAGCYRGRGVLFLFKQCICVVFVHGRSSWFYTARSPSTLHWS